MENLFRNKIALIAGDAGVIPQTTASAFLGQGATVVLAGQNHGKSGQDRRVHYISCELDHAHQVEKMIDEVISRYGRIDLAVNSSVQTPESGCEHKAWEKSNTGYLDGIRLCMRFEIARMVEAGGGTIINTSTFQRNDGLDSMASSIAGKHSLLWLTRTAARLQENGTVRINAVCHSDFMHGNGDKTSINAQAVEVARMALWLCSSEASPLHGELIDADSMLLAG